MCAFLKKRSVYQIDFSLCAAYINEEFVTFHLRSLTSSRDFFHLISYLIEIRIKQSFLYTVGGFSFFDPVVSIFPNATVFCIQRKPVYM